MSGWMATSVYVAGVVFATVIAALFFPEWGDDPEHAPAPILALLWPLLLAFALIALPFAGLVWLHEGIRASKRAPDREPTP